MKPAFPSKTRNPFLRLQPSLAAVAFAAFSAATVHATTYTWDGTSNAPWSDAKWSDGVDSAINWVNGATNDAVVNDGDVYADFGIIANSLTIGDGAGAASSASARFATNNAFWFINSITIKSDGILAGSADRTSHLLTVNLNGGTIGGGDDGGDAAFYGAIALHGPVNVNGGAVTSTISTTGGGILLVGPTSGDPTEFNVTDGAAAVDLLVSGNLVHRSFGDAEKLLKTGAGTMVLSGTNNYAGGTTVSGGTLQLNSSLAGNSNLTVNTGATVDVNGTNLMFNGTNVTLDGGTLRFIGGVHNHFNGALTLNGGTISTAGAGSYNGGNYQIDAATVTVGGSSASSIGAADGIQLGTTVDFAVADATASSATDLTVSGGIQNQDNGTSHGIVKSGAGTLTLSGANSYTGSTTINEGTLALQNTYGSSGFSIASGAVLELNVDSGTRDFGTATFSGGGTLRKTGSGNAVWGFGAGNFTQGAGSLIDVQEGTFAVGSSANENMSGSLADLNVAAGATFDSAACDAYVNALTGDGTVILAYTNFYARTMILGVNDGGGTFGGTISDGGSGGNGNLIKNGSGTQTLSGINTYTGNTTVNSGSLVLADNSQLKFVVTDAPAANIVTGTGTATFNGDFNIDTAAVSGTTGHIWLLVDLASLDPTTSFGSTFSVIGFTDPEDDGLWTMTDAKGDWSFDESTGELTLDVGNDYDDWKSANGVTGGENDDDDNDGLTNHEEYAFGLDPTGGSSVNPITVQLDKTTGKFTYTRRDPSLTDLTYTVWYSTDLATWIEDTGADESVTGPVNDIETVEVTLTPALLSNTKLFVQVRAN